jgi:protein SCO1
MFDGATPSAEIAAFADRVRTQPGRRDELLALLAEQSPIYAGRSANEVERLRGYLLASFEATGLPAAALRFVLEELETGIDPYAVAAAAKALRGATHVPTQAVPLLLRAIERIRFSDLHVCFDGWHAAAPSTAPTSALMELLRTMAWLGPRAAPARDALGAMAASREAFAPAVRAEFDRAIAATDRAAAPAAACCCGHEPDAPPRSQVGDEKRATFSGEIADLELQDQDGALVSFGTFFIGRPSVVAFFYTRCMNPNKCSLTITKLARLQERLGGERLQGRVNVAAITYDPAYDLPRRLYGYGADRGMRFDDRNRLLRATGTIERLRERFDLGVGYGTVTVNRHRGELFVLDRRTDTISSITRRQWSEDDVVAALWGALTTA